MNGILTSWAHYIHSRYYHRSSMNCRFYRVTRIALASFAALLPPKGALTYEVMEPKKFATEQSKQILKTLGANDFLLDLYGGVSTHMREILLSTMVQGMLNNTLTREEWEKKYMRPDALYIYRLGQTLAERAVSEKEEDRPYVTEMADMKQHGRYA